MADDSQPLNDLYNGGPLEELTCTGKKRQSILTLLTDGDDHAIQREWLVNGTVTIALTRTLLDSRVDVIERVYDARDLAASIKDNAEQWWTFLYQVCELAESLQEKAEQIH
jgi:hypothetical protein